MYIYADSESSIGCISMGYSFITWQDVRPFFVRMTADQSI